MECAIDKALTRHAIQNVGAAQKGKRLTQE